MNIVDEWRKLYGLRVNVTLSEDPLVFQTGVLEYLSDDGEAFVRSDLGVLHRCWPALFVERA